MDCTQLNQLFGFTPDEIKNSLGKATALDLKNLFNCMKSDFERSNPGSEIRLPDARTKSALCLMALYLAYKTGNPWFPKNLLDQLNGADCQFPRHAPRNYGIQIVSTRSAMRGLPTPPSGGHAYALASLLLTAPAPNRHVGINSDDFERLKALYNNRCATCGAEEGKPHYNPYYARSEIVVLQKGHMNPHLPLEPGNTIPQCQFCNRAYRNWLVFDRNGRTIGISEWNWVIRSLKRGYLRGEPPKEFIKLLTQALRQNQVQLLLEEEEQ